jgi:hypothetical membrane protein
MNFTDRIRSGLLIFIGALGVLTTILISERFCNNYRSSQMISDLGIGSSALFFNLSIIFCGILIIAAAYFLQKSGFFVGFFLLMGLIGAGMAGVGLFPENTGIPHLIAAAIVFLCGSITALISFRFFPAPWSWASGILGGIGLVGIILFILGYNLGLSEGVLERIIAYPLLFWAIGCGVFFMAPIKQT